MKTFSIKLCTNSSLYVLSFKDIGLEYNIYDVLNIIRKIINNYNELANRDSYQHDLLCYYLCKNLEGFGLSKEALENYTKSYPSLVFNRHNGLKCELKSKKESVLSFYEFDLSINFENFFINLNNLFTRLDEKQICDYFEGKIDLLDIENIPFNISNLCFYYLDCLEEELEKKSFKNCFKSTVSDKTKSYFILDKTHRFSTLGDDGISVGLTRRITGYLSPGVHVGTFGTGKSFTEVMRRR